MPPRKVEMRLVGDLKARATTFKKRKEGLKKKARELSTLCGVPVALVVAGAGAGAEAEVWESEAGVLGRYRALPAEARAPHTHAAYLGEELAKENAKLARVRQDGPGALAGWHAALNDATRDQARRLLEEIDAVLQATIQRKEALGSPPADGALEQIAPDASNAVKMPLLLEHDGGGVPRAGTNLVDMDFGSELQLMLRHGSKNGGPRELFQPRSADMTQLGYRFERTGGSGYQMQPPDYDLPDLAMRRAYEPCNAVPPLRCYTGDNFINYAPAHFDAATGVSYIDALPLRFADGIGYSLDDHAARWPAEEYQRSDTSTGWPAASPQCSDAGASSSTQFYQSF